MMKKYLIIAVLFLLDVAVQVFHQQVVVQFLPTPYGVVSGLVGEVGEEADGLLRVLFVKAQRQQQQTNRYDMTQFHGCKDRHF